MEVEDTIIREGQLCEEAQSWTEEEFTKHDI